MDVMTENKVVPKLRFLEFNDNWQQKTLGDVGDLINGLTYSPKDITDDGVLVLRSSNVQNNQLAFEDNVYVNVESFNPVKENDILICVRNGSKRLIGKNCLIDKNNEGVAFGAFMTVYRSINNKFIFHLFSLSSYYKTIHQNLGATINSINNNDLKKFKFFFPSLPEQQKLASFLSAVDEKLRQLTKKKELLEEYKKGVMQQIFSQELRFKDDNGNSYPNWEEKKLGEVMSERNIKAPKSNSYPLMSFVAYKGVRPKGKRYNREFLVNDEDNKKYKQTEYGDFIYSSNNLETGSIGLNRYGAASISPVYSIFKIGELCNYQFISSYLLRKSFINKMIRFRQGVVYGQWKIHESNFLKIQDKFPSLEEQNKIADFLSSLDSKIELVSTQIENIKAFKKGLLQQMFV